MHKLTNIDITQFFFIFRLLNLEIIYVGTICTYVHYILCFSTTSNIDNAYNKEKSGSSACSELEEVDFIPKRHKKDTKERSFGDKDTWEKLATIMKEPIKIETFVSDNSQSQDAPVQDNINHIVAVIENLLRQMEDERFLFGLKLLQLTIEKANELRNK